MSDEADFDLCGWCLVRKSEDDMLPLAGTPLLCRSCAEKAMEPTEEKLRDENARLMARCGEAEALLDAWCVAAEDEWPLGVLREQTLEWMWRRA